jgi:hypothetical protein
MGASFEESGMFVLAPEAIAKAIAFPFDLLDEAPQAVLAALGLLSCLSFLDAASTPRNDGSGMPQEAVQPHLRAC